MPGVHPTRPLRPLAERSLSGRGASRMGDRHERQADVDAAYKSAQTSPQATALVTCADTALRSPFITHIQQNWRLALSTKDRPGNPLRARVGPRGEIKKVPAPCPRRKWRKPSNDPHGNPPHRDPAFAGYRFGNQRSATSAGKPSRSGLRCDEAVSMPRSTRAAVTFLAPRSS